MSQFFQIHPDNPQLFLIQQAVDIVQSGGVIVYPTDSTYALGCRMGEKKAIERIRRIRQLPDRHNFTLVCRDLSELASYAIVDNRTYRFLKNKTPGAWVFILKATHQVPRLMLHPKRRTIGIRVPGNSIAQALLAKMEEPLVSTTLTLPGDEYPQVDPYEIRQVLKHQVDLVIDGGYCGVTLSRVVSLTEGTLKILRHGKEKTVELSD